MTFIDLHVLQTVPPSNLNRDDTGSPKSAVFGGVRRARVSSQAWKRAARAHFNGHLDRSDIGYRTKRIVDLVAAEIVRSGVEKETAVDLAVKLFGVLDVKVKVPRKSMKDAGAESAAPQVDYLVFISAGQVRKLAELAIDAHQQGRAVTKKDAHRAFKEQQSIDVAFFGRMVADDAELNVDAAVQVAHAISVHGVDNEFDYFTAVDDLQEADNITGAGMIGTVEFNSSTLYRYATINIEQLRENLGDSAATGRAAATFVDSFVRSMPTGKQNTFANRTLPEAVLVVVRDDQPVNLVGAFENPVERKPGESLIRLAAAAMASFEEEISAAYGQASASWVVGTAKATEHLASFGQPMALAELVGEIEALAARSAGGAL